MDGLKNVTILELHWVSGIPKRSPIWSWLCWTPCQGYETHVGYCDWTGNGSANRDLRLAHLRWCWFLPTCDRTTGDNHLVQNFSCKLCAIESIINFRHDRRMPALNMWEYSWASVVAKAGHSSICNFEFLYFWPPWYTFHRPPDDSNQACFLLALLWYSNCQHNQSSQAQKQNSIWGRRSAFHEDGERCYGFMASPSMVYVHFSGGWDETSIQERWGHRWQKQWLSQIEIELDQIHEAKREYNGSTTLEKILNARRDRTPVKFPIVGYGFISTTEPCNFANLFWTKTRRDSALQTMQALRRQIVLLNVGMRLRIPKP